MDEKYFEDKKITPKQVNQNNVENLSVTAEENSIEISNSENSSEPIGFDNSPVPVERKRGSTRDIEQDQPVIDSEKEIMRDDPVKPLKSKKSFESVLKENINAAAKNLKNVILEYSDKIKQLTNGKKKPTIVEENSKEPSNSENSSKPIGLDNSPESIGLDNGPEPIGADNSPVPLGRKRDNRREKVQDQPVIDPEKEIMDDVSKPTESAFDRMINNALDNFKSALRNYEKYAQSSRENRRSLRAIEEYNELLSKYEDVFEKLKQNSGMAPFEKIDSKELKRETIAKNNAEIQTSGPQEDNPQPAQ